MEYENIFWGKYKYYLLLFGVGLFVYFNGLFGAFVWDDIAQIQQNNLIHSLNIPSLFMGGTYTPENGATGAGTYYRPLMSFIFSLAYALSGAQSFLFHLTQVIIHIANSLLILLLFRNFLKEKLALLVAIVFLVHPMNVEAVSYMSALGEPLFVLFGLTALLVFQRKSTIKRAILVATLLLCSLFAKETGIVFFVILVAYYLLFARKQWKPVTVIVLTTIPFLVYLFMRFTVAKVHVERIPDVPMMTAPLADRIYTMPAMFWFYIKTFFFPKDLFILQLWSIPGVGPQFYVPLLLSLLVLSGIFGLGIWIGKTNKHNLRGFIFFTVWFLTGIGVHMQIIPLDFTVADRYFYFPMIGLLGILAISFFNLKKVSLPLKNIGMTVIILVIVVLSIRTLVRNTNWYNGLSLYSNDLQYQQNDRIENWLAIELVNAGRYDEASHHLEALLQRNPKESALYVNAAGNYELTGKFELAENVYQKGLAIDDSGTVHYAFARMLFQQGKFTESRAISEKGLAKFPQNGTLWFIQALADYKLGNKEKALEEIQKAKELIPNPTTEKAYEAIQNNLPL